MTTPKWAPGTLYQPGALVVPRTSSTINNGALNNPTFEAGNTGWALDGGVTINNDPAHAYQGSWCANFGNFASGQRQMVNTQRAPVSPGQPVSASAYFNLTTHTNTDGHADVTLFWYDASLVFISSSTGSVLSGGGGYRSSHVSDAAPAGAAFASVGLVTSSSANIPLIYVDSVAWDYVYQAPPDTFTYQAVQAAPGTSASVEPIWPLTLGGTVTDGGVTWQAVQFSRLTWQTSAIMTSGAVEPTWPTLVNDSVSDNAQIGWKATARQITDVKCPNTKVVAIGASKVFAGDNDIVPFSATVNPLDWSTAQDAGYLPTGLQNNGQNPVAVLALFNGNLVAFNSGGNQIWQIDQDPNNMAFLTGQPVGSTFTKAAQAVANDLLFLSPVGVRNMNVASASTNLQAAGVGNPIDPLIIAAIKTLTADQEPISLYVSGRGQYWLIFNNQAFVLTSYGPGKSSWARYTFSENITDWTLLADTLLLRTASNKVWYASEDYLSDDVTTSVVTMTIASPCVVTLTNHGFVNGDPVVLSTTGALPTGLVAGTTYYIVNATTNTFGLAATLGGTAINTTGSQSGVHTAVVTPAAGLWTGVLWWPFLDLNNPGIDKALIGFDLVGTGMVTVQVGYDQRDFNVLTPAYVLSAADTTPGNPVPLPLTAPSFSLKLTFSANQAWEWNTSNLYIQDGNLKAAGGN